MKERLPRKLERIRSNLIAVNSFWHMHMMPICHGESSALALVWPPPSAGAARFRTLPEYLDDIRKVVSQGVVDVLLASVPVMDRIAHREHRFCASDITPAIHTNDTKDVSSPRGVRCHQSSSLPLVSSCIYEAQHGALLAEATDQPIVKLGLYSAAFNGVVESEMQDFVIRR